MKVMERLRSLPRPILSRVFDIVEEQGCIYNIHKDIGTHQKLRMSDIFSTSKTAEGAAYWKTVQNDYLNIETEISDQEYLIVSMEDVEIPMISLSSIREIINHSAERIGINKKTRKREIVSLRNAFWTRVYRKFNVSLMFIGEATCPDAPFNHATVIHGMKQHFIHMKQKDKLAIMSEETIKNLKHLQ